MRFIALILGFLLISACQTTPTSVAGQGTSSSISYTGGDGTSKETAIIIVGARSSSDGVPAEYDWIEENLPGAKIESQGLLPGTRSYDVFEVTLASGDKRLVYFEITSFFGKQ